MSNKMLPIEVENNILCHTAQKEKRGKETVSLIKLNIEINDKENSQ